MCKYYVNQCGGEQDYFTGAGVQVQAVGGGGRFGSHLWSTLTPLVARSYPRPLAIILLNTMLWGGGRIKAPASLEIKCIRR